MRAEPRSVRFSALAEQDLEEIWAYTARKWSTDQAGRYHADIMGAIDRLARGDGAGRDIGDIRPGYLKYSVERHFLFYRLTAAHLIVIRILHQSMDVDRRLQDSSDGDVWRMVGISRYAHAATLALRVSSASLSR